MRVDFFHSLPNPSADTAWMGLHRTQDEREPYQKLMPEIQAKYPYVPNRVIAGIKGQIIGQLKRDAEELKPAERPADVQQKTANGQ